MRKKYDETWGSLLNKRTRCYLIKTIPLAFYQEFASYLVDDSPVTWDCFNACIGGFEGTILWNTRMHRICLCNTQWMWIYNLNQKLNWIDYDQLNGDIYFHMCRLHKLGKLKVDF